MLGIIPAGAGKSTFAGFWASPRADHPRGCGEKAASIMACRALAGSSPRVRGKVGGSERAGAWPGIIPAGAGKRLLEPTARRHPRDHPRGCGEKLDVHAHGVLLSGSSPRVRGKDDVVRFEVLVNGIIPAGAGKSRACRSTGPAVGDHPRGCGEKRQAPPPPRRHEGSSPRVRGKVARILRGGKSAGIIPAGAGKRVLLWGT